VSVQTAPTFSSIAEARERLRASVRVTPVFASETLSRRAGREVVLKAENLQRTGAFKIRGAVNTLAGLTPEERAVGVVAASAGNHGQAVAWAAREAGIPATIFVPLDAPMAKVDAARNYGATVELAGEMFDDALAAANEHVERTGATFVHAFDDPRVIAGQGTLGLELAEQLPEDGTVVIPVGGGGLASGVAIALRELRPRLTLVGVQAAACAPLANADTPRLGFTIADGIAVKKPGALTTPILHELLDEIVAVEDERISEAIVLLLERTKLVVEGAGAAPVAALLAGLVAGEGPVCCVLAGGNIDPSTLISVMRHGLTVAGRYLVLRTRISDRPGSLIKLLELIARERVNVLSVEHHREGMALTVAETEVELTLAARDGEHCDALLASLRDNGYAVELLR
jgi:threonine dehydratase